MLDELFSRVTGLFGSDPDAMRRAAHELYEQAERIHRCADSIRAELDQVWWKGPDADRFRAQWDQVHRRESHQIAYQLRDMAIRLRHAALEQERASNR